MITAICTQEELSNPNALGEIFQNEILQSVYFRERSKFHVFPERTNASLECAVLSAAEYILNAEAVVFITGAGAGMDMGLPDFRTSDKFWKQLNHPGIIRYEDSSKSSLFQSEPEFAWGLNYHQLRMYREAKVHAGYEIFAKIARMKEGKYFCYTTNIDGVLQRSGLDASKVREVHGNIHRVQCTHAYCKNDTNVSDAWIPDPIIDLSINTSTMVVNTDITPLPLCPNCNTRIIRPNVWYCTDGNYVLYRKSIPISNAYHSFIYQYEAPRCDDEEEEVVDNSKVMETSNPSNTSGTNKRRRLVVIECGAGLVIPSARVESEEVSDNCHGVLIRINPVDCSVPRNESSNSINISIPLGMKEGLTLIYEQIMKLQTRQTDVM